MYKLLLCLRYLRSRYIALASIISVMLGVATMIVVNSVMAGFSTEMRERIHGLLADIVVETSSLDGRPDAAGHMAMVQQVAGKYVEAMTTTVEVYGMLSFQYHGEWITRPVTLIGIKPHEKAKVGPLIDFLQSYKPTIVDGKIVRPAERSADELPSWKLTTSAQENQKLWNERQQMLVESFSDLDGDDPSSPEQPAPNSEQNDLDPSQPVPDVNPFDAVSFDDAKETNESSEGFLYVGLGLISFPYEDKQGQVQTMMMVQPGETVAVSTVRASRPPEATHFNATVVDLFKTGMSEYDSNLVFCNLEYLQKVRGMIDPTSRVGNITSIQIKLKDFADAEQVVEQLQSIFPPGIYTVKTWEQKQGPLLAAVEIESAILNVLLFLIIAVAGFGILAIFYMIVVEKTRDIGILKALGASSAGVMSIFLSYGLALGVVGSGVGVIIGLLFVKYINVIESWISWLTGRDVFPETIYYFPEIPTAVHPAMVIWVSAGAMTIAVLASILPARRAARLHPVESLRFE